ncbi:MAG: hypothetical protein H7338_05235 [Candidatus Sericytochromatia bacterium]|nr:hypothetical protein [Candidatus Sericytochromatia bacterium]
MLRPLLIALLLTGCATGAVDSFTYLRTITKTPTASETPEARPIIASFPLHIDPKNERGPIDSASPIDVPATWQYRHQGSVTMIEGLITNQQTHWAGLSVRAEGRNTTNLDVDNAPLSTGPVPMGGQTPIALVIENPSRQPLDVKVSLLLNP